MGLKNLLQYLKVKDKTTLNTYWDEVGPLIKSAADKLKLDYDLHELKLLIVSQYIDLHIGFNEDDEPVLAFTTQVLRNGWKKGRLAVIHIGGKGDPQWEQTFAYLKKYGREQKCNRLTFNGRKGWIKRIAHLGFKPKTVIMEAEI